MTIMEDEKVPEPILCIDVSVQTEDDTIVPIVEKILILILRQKKSLHMKTKLKHFLENLY